MGPGALRSPGCNYTTQRRESMGQPVVHFEVISKDPDGLRKFFGELFDWQFGEAMCPVSPGGIFSRLPR